MFLQLDLEKLYPSFSPPLIITSTIVLLFIAALFLSRFYEKSSLPLYSEGDSILKKRWMFDGITLLQEGYHKFYDKPFRVWTTEGVQTSLPPKYVDEVKMLPDLTFPSSLRDFMQSSYTMAVSEPQKLDCVNSVIKSDLNKNMSKVFPMVKEEVDVGIPVEFPPCEDWTPILVYNKALRLICRISGRAFVGPSLNRNEEWIDISCSWTRNVFTSAVKLKMIPSFLRPIGSYFVPEIKKCLNQNARARDLLTPIIKEREEAENKLGYEKPNDAIEWVRDLPEVDKKDYGYQGVAQLAIGAVSIHTVTQLTTNTIFNLATYPEYVPILRDEIDTVLAESGGEFKLESMSKLKKLDSFLKETLRFNTLTTITFQRKVLRPITLSDGTLLPTGTLTFSPSNAIASDSTIYPNADTFDGLRFYNLREASAEDGNKYQLTSISSTQMFFGAGRHACPGRWFASHEIKLVIASLMSRYEFRLKGGEERPKSILFQHGDGPDPKAEILFLSRKA